MTRHGRVCVAGGGFATITMLLSVALVGMALVAISSMFAAEARRTQSGQQEAQLRQLLTAGALAGRELAADLGATPGTAAVTLELPAQLVAHHGAVHITLLAAGRPGQRTIQVNAALDNRHASQILTFTPGPTGWRAVDARMK